MKFFDIIKLAAKNTFRGGVRSALTALSITVGIMAVMLISSIGISGSALINGEIEKTGLQGVSVYKAEDAPAAASLTEKDVDRLKKRFKIIENAIPMIMDMGQIKLNKFNSQTIVFGVGADADKVYNIRILHGRIPNKADIKLKKKIAVIDDELAIKAYKRTNVVGKKIKVAIGNKSDFCEIIGVIGSQKDGVNKMFGNSIPDFVYVPYSTLNELRQSEEITQIAIKCTDSENDGMAFAEYLSKTKGIKNGYMAENLSSRMGEIKSLTSLVTMIISAISAISLCVAGIGIMNSMFSSTSERSREIGVCMAIGATGKDILLCFLFESIFIALFGGSIGALFGFLITYILSNVLNIEMIFNIKMFLTAELISLLCGSMFSVVPAIKASRMNPIAALRRR